MRPLTHERLLEVLDYNPAAGIFTWRVKQARNTRVGGRAGGARNGSYYVRIDETDYTGARLAWFFVTGKWPHRLKFADGDKLNLRFDNLAETNALPKGYDTSTPEGRAQYLRDHYRVYEGARRDQVLRRKFGISVKAYDLMHSLQDGCCAICGKAEGGMRKGKVIRLAVDHNHTTGAVRDLLCRACNQLIGNASEDITVLQSAIDYLTRHSAAEAADRVASSLQLN